MDVDIELAVSCILASSLVAPLFTYDDDVPMANALSLHFGLDVTKKEVVAAVSFSNSLQGMSEHTHDVQDWLVAVASKALPTSLWRHCISCLDIELAVSCILASSLVAPLFTYDDDVPMANALSLHFGLDVTKKEVVAAVSFSNSLQGMSEHIYIYVYIYTYYVYYM